MEPRALIHIKSESYKYTFCNRLHGLQQEGLFCDLYLKSDKDESCPLHLCVAVAGSPFIKSVLDSVDASSNKTAVGFAIPFADLSLAMLHTLTKFMYTGEIETEKEDLENVLMAAELLQMEEMVQAVKKTILKLKSIELSNSNPDVQKPEDTEQAAGDSLQSVEEKSPQKESQDSNAEVDQPEGQDEEAATSASVRKSARVRRTSKRFSDEFVLDQDKAKKIEQKAVKDSPKKGASLLQEPASQEDTTEVEEGQDESKEQDTVVSGKMEDGEVSDEAQNAEMDTDVSGTLFEVKPLVEDFPIKDENAETDADGTFQDVKEEEYLDTEECNPSQLSDSLTEAGAEGQKRKSMIDPRVLQIIRKKGRGKVKATPEDSPQGGEAKKRKVGGGSHGRERSYRRYTPEDMMKAYDLCQGGMPIAKAARMMGIPKNTLYDRVHGNTKKGKFSPGPDRLFSTYEEVGMVRIFHMLAAYGYGCFISEIRKLASHLAVQYGHRPKVNTKTGRPTLISKRWTKEFFNRRPELRLGGLKLLANDRDRRIAKKTIENFYEELGITVDNYELEDKPEYLLRIEETEVKLPCKEAAAAGAGESANAACITVLSCYTAEGQILPPYFVVPSDASEDFLQSGINYAVSPTGRPCVDTLQKYVEEHLIQYLLGDVGEQHTLILYDGCKSDICTSLVESSFGHKMVLLVTPAYCGDALSAFEAGYFGPLRVEYSKAMEEFMKEGTFDENLTQTDVCNIMHQVYYKVVTPMYAMKAFEERGFYPFNLDKVTDIFNVFKSDMSAPADEELEDDIKLDDTVKLDEIVEHDLHE